MNEKSIQQVLEIEKRAQEVFEKAKLEAQELPVLAEQEAQAMIAKTKEDAQDQARKLIAQAQSENEATTGILSEVERKNTEFESQAKANLDKAVAYVLERVIGRA